MIIKYHEKDVVFNDKAVFDIKRMMNFHRKNNEESIAGALERIITMFDNGNKEYE